MLFERGVIEIIKGCAEWADKLTRADLVAGVIVSENDYTSNLTAALRREINARSIPGLTARIQVLEPLIERRVGADGCIILSNSREFKAGIFEAKWPRLSSKINSWDSLQHSSKASHFDDQLERQHSAADHLAIWEMFYSEHPFGEQPEYMPNEGSACVWHDTAYAASSKRESNNVPWTDVELEKLLKGNSNTLADIIGEICECKRGKPMAEESYSRALSNFIVPREALVISYKTSPQNNKV